MKNSSSTQILSNLYGLMMEINFYRLDEDVLSELAANPDPEINEHLLKVKQLNAKLKAQKNNEIFKNAIEQLRLLKEKGLDEFKKLFSKEDQEQYVRLYRKFEELTKEDEALLLQDQELLIMLEKLKSKIDGNQNQ